MERISLNTKVLLSVLIFLILVFAGCTQSPEQAGLAKVSVSIVDDTNSIIFSGTKDINKGLNAFDALKEVVGENNIQYKSYDFGIFVEGFFGKTAPKTHFWSLFVNGKKAESGIMSYSIDFDTNLDWKLEKIEEYP